MFRIFCSHSHRRMERRDLDSGIPAVLHYVCESCGDAVPVVDREDAYYDRMRDEAA